MIETVNFTDVQLNLLRLLANSKPEDTTAEKTGFWLRTYQSLETKGLAKSVRMAGYLTNPKANIRWVLTELGRLFLAEVGDG